MKNKKTAKNLANTLRGMGIAVNIKRRKTGNNKRAIVYYGVFNNRSFSFGNFSSPKGYEITLNKIIRRQFAQMMGEFYCRLEINELPELLITGYISNGNNDRIEITNVKDRFLLDLIENGDLNIAWDYLQDQPNCRVCSKFARS